MVFILIFFSVVAFFVLLFAIRAKVIIEVNDEFRLSVSVLGIKINILPKKAKKYNLRKYTLKKIAKRDKKALKKQQKKAQKAALKKKKKNQEKKATKTLTKEEIKAQKKAKKESRPAISDLISLFSEVAKLFFSSFLAHFHVYVAKIHIGVATGDAAKTALAWCGVCTVLQPTLIFLGKHSNLHGMRRADINIVPDYVGEKTSIDIKIGFSMSLFGLFCVLIKTGIKFLKGWLKIKPPDKKTPPDTKSDNTKSAPTGTEPDNKKATSTDTEPEKAKTV